MIPAGLPTMIAGRPKSRKSLLAYYFAICVAAGIDALGRKTRRGRVLVISREDGPRETKRRLFEIARALGVDLRQLVDGDHLRVEAERPLYLDRSSDVAALRATMDEFRPDMLVIDSLSRVNSADENDRSSMVAVTNTWNDLCSQFRARLCSCITSARATGRSSNRSAGRGDLAAVLRIAIGVTKVDGRTSKLETDGNLANLAPSVSITFDDRNVLGEKHIAIAPLVAEQKATRAAKDLRATVLAVLEATPQYKSRSAVITAAQVARSPGFATIKELIAERMLRRRTITRACNVVCSPRHATTRMR